MNIPRIKYKLEKNIFLFDDHVIGVGDAFRNWIEFHPSGAIKVYENIDVVSGYAQIVFRSDYKTLEIDKSNIFKEFRITIPNSN